MIQEVKMGAARDLCLARVSERLSALHLNVWTYALATDREDTRLIGNLYDAWPSLTPRERKLARGLLQDNGLIKRIYRHPGAAFVRKPLSPVALSLPYPNETRGGAHQISRLQSRVRNSQIYLRIRDQYRVMGDVGHDFIWG